VRCQIEDVLSPLADRLSRIDAETFVRDVILIFHAHLKKYLQQPASVRVASFLLSFHLKTAILCSRYWAFTGFDWVLLGFTRFYWVLFDFTGFL